MEDKFFKGCFAAIAALTAIFMIVIFCQNGFNGGTYLASGMCIAIIALCTWQYKSIK